MNTFLKQTALALPLVFGLAGTANDANAQNRDPGCSTPTGCPTGTTINNNVRTGDVNTQVRTGDVSTRVRTGDVNTRVRTGDTNVRTGDVRTGDNSLRGGDQNARTGDQSQVVQGSTYNYRPAANAPLTFAPGTTAIPLGANGCAFATSWSVAVGVGTVVAVPSLSFSGPASERRNTRCEATRLHVENALISAGMGQAARTCLFQNAAVRTIAEAQEAFLAASAEDPELAAAARRECLGQLAHQVAAQAIRSAPRPGRDG